LFYYSGYGIQSNGNNYFIPVDADLQSEAQVEYDCVQIDRVLAFMNAPKGTIIAFATSPGSTVSDVAGSNNLYTSALLENIKTPDITIEEEPITGTLRIECNNGGTFSIDGVSKGEFSAGKIYTLKNMPAGEHIVKVGKWTTTVIIENNIKPSTGHRQPFIPPLPCSAIAAT
jgi:hypothetical protein